MRTRGMVLVCGLLCTSLVSGAGADTVSHITIDTDRSVNCASIESIVADVTQGCRTDREKAIALYNFVVRTVWMPYVYGHPHEIIDGRLQQVREPLKIINVYGAIGCDTQAKIFCTLLAEAGVESRLLDPGFAHGSNEVKWDGRWHWLDVWLPCYLMDESDRIYSYDELMADRSLIGKAIEAGRVSDNFMFNPKPDTEAIVKAGPHRPSEPGAGVVKCAWHENLSLRPGESCTWLWDFVDKWYWPGEKFAFPAFKFTRNENCKQAFDYWEPYKKTLKGGPHPWYDVYYRYYGNAFFETNVSLTDEGLKDLGAKMRDGAFVAEGGVKNTAGTDMATVDIDFVLPYVVADSEITGVAETHGSAVDGGGSVSVLFSVDGGQMWLLGGEVRGDGAFGPIRIGRPNMREYPAGSTSGQYRYSLRIVLRPNWRKEPTVLKSLKVSNWTMLNFYSRPWLEAGSNRITVTADAETFLKPPPLKVTWRWVENWRDAPAEKTFSHSVARSGSTAVIEVGGDQRPRMKSVRIERPIRSPDEAADSATPSDN